MPGLCLAFVVISSLVLSGIQAQCGGNSTSAPCSDSPNYAAACAAAFCNGTSTLESACDDPVYATLVPNCAASCGKCAEFGFGCNNTISEDECLALAVNCDNPDMYPIMVAYCPRTCGFCPKPNGGANCVDRAQNCSAIAAFCNNPSTYDTMTQECGKTCNRCSANGTATVAPGGTTPRPTGDCTDIASNCQQNIAFCNNPQYAPLMQQQCRKTCGFCTKTAACMDNDPECIKKYFMKGFCWDSAVSNEQKSAKCAKSCGLCHV